MSEMKKGTLLQILKILKDRKGYYEQLDATKFEILVELDIFLEKYSIPKLTQEMAFVKKSTTNIILNSKRQSFSYKVRHKTKMLVLTTAI